MVDDNHGLVRIHYLPRVLYVDRGERFFDAIEPFSEGWSIRRHGSNVGDCQKLSATYGNMISFAKKKNKPLETENTTNLLLIVLVRIFDVFPRLSVLTTS